MRKSVFLMILFVSVFLPAQEIPSGDEQEPSPDPEISEIVEEETFSGMSISESTGGPEIKESIEVQSSAKEPLTDEALVWDDESEEGEEPLPDSSPTAGVMIPIRLRAEQIARAEADKIAGIVKATEAQKALLFEVLTDLHVKEIRINENPELKKSKKSIQMTSLRIERNSRIRAVLDKEQYKLYRESLKAVAGH